MAKNNFLEDGEERERRRRGKSKRQEVLKLESPMLAELTEFSCRNGHRGILPVSGTRTGSWAVWPGPARRESTELHVLFANTQSALYRSKQNIGGAVKVEINMLANSSSFQKEMLPNDAILIRTCISINALGLIKQKNHRTQVPSSAEPETERH